MLKNPYIEITRPNVCVLAALAYVVGALVVSVSANLSTSFFLHGLLSVWLVCAGGNVINDYFDRFIDAVNRPERPIPSGRISARNALLYYAFLNSLAIVFAYGTTQAFVALVMLNIAVSFVYSYKLKKTFFLGNFVDSYLASICFVAPLFLVSHVMHDMLAFLLILGSVAFLGNLGREIIKDVEDMSGDKKAGAKTIPIVLGREKAFFIARALLIFAASFAVLPLSWGYVSYAYLAGYLPSLYFIASSISKRDASSAQKRIKIAMFLLILGLLLGIAL